MYLIACAAFVALRGGALFLSVLAIFAVGLLAIRLYRVVRRELDDGVTTPGERWTMTGLVAAVGVGLLAVWVVGDRPDGVGFFGVALLYVTVGIGVQELRSWQDVPARAFVGIVVGSTVVAFLAVAAAAIGLESAAVVAVGAALLGVPLGLSLVSELASRQLDARSLGASIVLLAVGTALLVAALGALHWRGVGATYVAVLGVGCLLLMLAIAARSNIDVVFVVAAAAVVWTLGNRGVPEPDALRPAVHDKVVVALGDSFISGEGAEEFFDGTNQPGKSTCRRAPTAYPVLLVLERRIDVPDHLVFVACSGAKAAQVIDGDNSQIAEVLRRAAPIHDRVSFVLLSIGGNDALFGTIAQACMAPVNCTRLEPAFVRHLANVGATLDRTYGAIAKALPDAKVVVVPYPIPIASHGCDWSAFSGQEHAFLNRFTARLDATVTRAAADRGFSVVDTMPDALAGLRLCDGRPSDAGVNFLAANSVFGTLEQSVNPTNWVHNSLHPNARGHEAMRAALVAWLVGHPDLPAASAPPDEVAASTGNSHSPCATATNLDACTKDWLIRELARVLLTEGLLILPVLAGAWLVALQLLRMWRGVFGPAAP